LEWWPEWLANINQCITSKEFRRAKGKEKDKFLKGQAWDLNPSHWHRQVSILSLSHHCFKYSVLDGILKQALFDHR